MGIVKMETYRETPMEELRVKMEKAKALGLVNVIARISEEIRLRESVPNIKERATIRKLMIIKDAESFQEIIDNHKDEVEQMMNGE